MQISTQPCFHTFAVFIANITIKRARSRLRCGHRLLKPGPNLSADRRKRVWGRRAPNINQFDLLITCATLFAQLPTIDETVFQTWCVRNYPAEDRHFACEPTEFDEEMQCSWSKQILKKKRFLRIDKKGVLRTRSHLSFP